VSSDNRRVFGIRAAGVPGECQGEAAVLDWGLGPALVSRRGRFHLSVLGSIAPSIRGSFLSRGRAHGRSAYFDRGGCGASASWSARAHGHARGRGRVFAAAGGARLSPGGMAELPDGSLLFADGRRVRLLLPDGRLVSVAGPSDGLDVAEDVALSGAGSYLIADSAANCVRAVGTDGAIHTVAGHCGSAAAFGGDGGLAVSASLDFPTAVVQRPGGGFFVADTGNDRVRAVLPDGRIVTVAGTGAHGFSGDGGPATLARLDRPSDVEVDHGGRLLIADEDNERVRRVALDGSIATVAGSGSGGLAAAGFRGDDGPATEALLSDPSGLAATTDGGFLIADSGNGRIRKVAASGRITTVAGGGEATGGVRPGSTDLGRPRRVAVTQRGFAVSDAQEIRFSEPHTTRLLVELRRRTDGLGQAADLRASRGARAHIRVSTSRRCRLTLEVTRRGRTLIRLRRVVRAGDTILRLARRLPPGRYRVTASARVSSRVAASVGYLSVR
jgi:DNA-binding beta-propeller fold protein YncE